MSLLVPFEKIQTYYAQFYNRIALPAAADELPASSKKRAAQVSETRRRQTMPHSPIFFPKIVAFCLAKLHFHWPGAKHK